MFPRRLTRGRKQCLVVFVVLILGLVLEVSPATMAGPAASADASGMFHTVATGVNCVGDIVGHYHHGDRLLHGFLLSGGTFTYIEFPGSLQTSALAINEFGDVVGTYWDAAGVQHGYIFSGGTYTTIDVPICKCDPDPT